MSCFWSRLEIVVAIDSMFAGVGRFGGSSFRSLSFFFDRSTYYYTSLDLAVSCMIKNHSVQLDGLLRMMLIFDSLVVVIFRIDRSGRVQLASWRKPYFDVPSF